MVCVREFGDHKGPSEGGNESMGKGAVPRDDMNELDELLDAGMRGDDAMSGDPILSEGRSGPTPP